MKKFIYSIFAIFLLASCDDFLAESPKSQQSLNQFFKTGADARGAVNSIYRTGYLGAFGGASEYAKATGIMSGLFLDDVWGPGRIGHFGQELSLDATKSSQLFYGTWRGMYTGIARANVALKYINNIPGLSDAETNRLHAEARFFRAMNYFALIKDYGDIPLLLEPVETLEGIFAERTDYKIIYNHIIEDLNWVLTNGNLASVPFPMNGFRITRGAVEALLSEVHLQMAGYPMQNNEGYVLAAQTARALINSGQYELIQNGATLDQSAYNIIRTTDVQKEYILTFEMNEDIATNGWPQMCFPNGINFPGLAYPGNIGPGFAPTENFLNLFDPVLDLRAQNQQLFYSSIEIGGNLISWKGQGVTVSWYWFDNRAAFQTARGGQDVKIYRYPLVLLIAAEAIAQTEGVTSEAIQYLTDVRSRAYWQTDRSIIESELSGLSVQAFVEEVWKERIRELSLDFKLWDQIRRTRKYPVSNSANPGKVQFVEVVGADNGWGNTFQEHHLIYPIPLEEMQRNPELTQNPGY